jgi:hypothetical protein
MMEPLVMQLHSTSFNIRRQFKSVFKLNKLEKQDRQQRNVRKMPDYGREDQFSIPANAIVSVCLKYTHEDGHLLGCSAV